MGFHFLLHDTIAHQFVLHSPILVIKSCEVYFQELITKTFLSLIIYSISVLHARRPLAIRAASVKHWRCGHLFTNWLTIQQIIRPRGKHAFFVIFHKIQGSDIICFINACKNNLKYSLLFIFT